MKKTAEIPVKSKTTQTPVQKKQAISPKAKAPVTPGTIQNKAPGNPTPNQTNTLKNTRPTPDGRVTADKGMEGRNTALRSSVPNQEQKDKTPEQIERQKDPTSNPKQPGQRPDWPEVHAQGENKTKNQKQQTGYQDPELEEELGIDDFEAEARRK